MESSGKKGESSNGDVSPRLARSVHRHEIFQPLVKILRQNVAGAAGNDSRERRRCKRDFQISVLFGDEQLIGKFARRCQGEQAEKSRRAGAFLSSTRQTRAALVQDHRVGDELGAVIGQTDRHRTDDPNLFDVVERRRRNRSDVVEILDVTN